jgi:DNA-binding NarL/FixJ family response regulator
MPRQSYAAPDETASPSLRVLLADDHEMVRLAMKHALAALAERVEWLEAATADEVTQQAAREPDLALLDFNMPGTDGLPWLARLRTHYPSLPLVVVSAQESPELVRALVELGVAGFIPKSDSAAVVLQAVRLVLAGGTYAPVRFLSARPVPGQPQQRDGAESAGALDGLTPRQQDVLALLARGLPNKSIAREMGLSEGTVKVHLLAIFRALDVRNRTEAVVAAQKRLRATGL